MCAIKFSECLEIIPPISGQCSPHRSLQPTGPYPWMGANGDFGVVLKEFDLWSQHPHTSGLRKEALGYFGSARSSKNHRLGAAESKV